MRRGERKREKRWNAVHFAMKKRVTRRKEERVKSARFTSPAKKRGGNGRTPSAFTRTTEEVIIGKIKKKRSTRGLPGKGGEGQKEDILALEFYGDGDVMEGAVLRPN